MQLMKEAKSFRGVSKNEVIVVGRIDISPRLKKDEQDFYVPGIVLFDFEKPFRNKVMLQFNAQPVASANELVINPRLGKLFYFKVPRNNKYIVNGYIVTGFLGLGKTAKIKLPTGFKVNFKKGDKAVYIGHLKYKRDDFDSIVSVKLKDNYNKAKKYFRKIFGKKYKLRKSLMRKI